MDRYIFLVIAILALLATNVCIFLNAIKLEQRVNKSEIHIDVLENMVTNILTQLRGKP
jgi:hypothetical protein